MQMTLGYILLFYMCVYILCQGIKRDFRKIQDFPKDCKDIQGRGDNLSGVKRIKLKGKSYIHVYCNMNTDGGGWTVSNSLQYVYML